MFVKENSIRVSCYITQIGILIGNPTREEGKERPHSNKAAAKRDIDQTERQVVQLRMLLSGGNHQDVEHPGLIVNAHPNRIQHSTPQQCTSPFRCPCPRSARSYA